MTTNAPTAPATQQEQKLLDITLTFNEQEQHALISMVDFFLKNHGLKAMGVSQHFLAKMEGAQQIARAVSDKTVPSAMKKKTK